MRLLFVFFIAFCGQLAVAQSMPVTVLSEKTYFSAFAKVNVAIHGLAWVAEVCRESFPEMAVVNDKALLDWQRRYQPFLGEMEQHFEKIDAYKRSRPAAENTRVLTAIQIRKHLDLVRASLRQEMFSQEKQMLRSECTGFASALATPRYDLEKFYADRVAIIRRGPEELPASSGSPMVYPTLAVPPAAATTRLIERPDAAVSPPGRCQTLAECKQKATIVYPPRARALGITGELLLEFVIDTEGNSKDIKILRRVLNKPSVTDSDGNLQNVTMIFDQEAIRFARSVQWPSQIKDGKLTEIRVQVPLNFSFEEKVKK